MERLKPVDHSALKANQLIIISLNILAFILNAPWLAGIVALAMLLGAASGKPGFGLVYERLLKPRGWLKPQIVPDNPEPHRFAQGLGGSFMLAGAIALFLGAAALGWGLVWLVAALAALNAFGGFCVGCFFYYWFGRLGLPGFSKQPPANTFPGRRPQGSNL